jgi:opacity protein-like surface antigen
MPDLPGGLGGVRFMHAAGGAVLFPTSTRNQTMRNGSLVALTALFASLSLPLLAEAQMRPWEISIGGGPSLARGDIAGEAGTGYHVQGSVGFGIPLLPFGLRADAFWQELADEQDGWFRQVGGLLNATIGIPMLIVSPYGLIGVGYLRASPPDVQHPGHTHTGESENIVGFNAGAGLAFPFVGLSGFVEARFLNLFGGGNATNYQAIPITFGVRF